jgi:hypothetical protein
LGPTTIVRDNQLQIRRSLLGGLREISKPGDDSVALRGSEVAHNSDLTGNCGHMMEAAIGSLAAAHVRLLERH